MLTILETDIMYYTLFKTIKKKAHLWEGSGMRNEERNEPVNGKAKVNALQFKKTFQFVIFIAISKLNLKLFS